MVIEKVQEQAGRQRSDRLLVGILYWSKMPPTRLSTPGLVASIRAKHAGSRTRIDGAVGLCFSGIQDNSCTSAENYGNGFETSIWLNVSWGVLVDIEIAALVVNLLK